jgi:targeting protein for Xklp2
MSPAIQKPKPKLIKEPSPVQIKANPVPDLSKPFVPKIEHRVLPEPEFSLPGDAILRKRREELNEKLRKQADEEKRIREFKANPLALPEKVSMTSSEAFELQHEIKITEPVPFNLQTDFRGELYQQQFQEKVKELTAVKPFHANPMPNLEPFIPKRSEKPLTEVEAFSLNTDARAEERRKFEESQSKRLQMEEEAKRALEKQKEVLSYNLRIWRKRSCVNFVAKSSTKPSQ